jgi:type I restriction enzyme, S subunit
MVITAHNINQKPGYKQTEVGVIPEDWGVSKVGAEFEIQLGKMLDAEKNTGLPKPYLGNKAVQWNRIDISDLQTMAMSRSDLERFRLRHGDLLVCEGGEVGRAAIWEAPIEECYYQKALHRLRPLRGFNPRLMLALLQYWTDHGKLADYVSQTSIAHLTREKFIEVPMPVPTPDEQHAITTVLSDVDALIALLDRLIAKKRDIKQATMQQLLTGKTRLPGFNEEWKVRKLGEIADIVSGGTPSTTVAKFWRGNIKWCTPTDITRTSGKYLTDTEKHISEAGLKYSSANLLPIGSLLLCSRATIGEVKIAASIVCTNQGFKSLICSKDVCNEFLYYVILTIKPKLVEKAIGSTFLEISKKDTASLEIALPSLPEQQAIATVLSDMDAEIAALEQKRDKTRALKQGMMQELLTGKTRLL